MSCAKAEVANVAATAATPIIENLFINAPKGEKSPAEYPHNRQSIQFGSPILIRIIGACGISATPRTRASAKQAKSSDFRRGKATIQARRS
jgi:hypothetical protein